MTCQIHVLNKQLASPFSWNNPLSETLIGQPTITDGLHAKKKQHFGLEGVYNM